MNGDSKEMSVWSKMVKFYYSFAPKEPTRRSRGHLILDWLLATSPASRENYLNCLEKHQAEYNGFNLVIGNNEKVQMLSHKCADAHTIFNHYSVPED